MPQPGARNKVPFEPTMTKLFKTFGTTPESEAKPLIVNIDWSALTPSPSGAVVTAVVSLVYPDEMLDHVSTSTKLGGASGVALNMKIGSSDKEIPLPKGSTRGIGLGLTRSSMRVSLPFLSNSPDLIRGMRPRSVHPKHQHRQPQQQIGIPYFAPVRCIRSVLRHVCVHGPPDQFDLRQLRGAGVLLLLMCVDPCVHRQGWLLHALRRFK